MPFGNNWPENFISATDSARDGSCEKSPRKLSMDSLYGPAWDAGHKGSGAAVAAVSSHPGVAILATQGGRRERPGKSASSVVVGVVVEVAELRATTTGH